uniref:Uncharacterized protein n=1 Tax=Ananas comosus var. bracteatus TaxID=296719 RepID=A0A6V7Q284_ANACO|nr:unnamed protein product [Ananas comosus var. bracteatus]
MQNREMDNFLLHTSDDFEDSISKLRYFSDYKPVTTVPAKGESSDLLNVDGDKNDYDWLLTPPDTPLFPSLDDEEPQRLSMAPRGRPQSQPISISRSSTLENTRTPRTSRGSASPHRLSPSPRSSSSVVQSRPSSASHSSPPPALRSSTPSRRPSPPPAKPSTPTTRSSTPTLRRMSSISSSQPFSSGKRGVSPVKASRGNSASPKLRGWQTSLPGFSSETPPNLRTSLSDRSVSRSRGVSPASTAGGDSYSKYRRQSMSPTPSRSASSSRSHERDLFSLSGKASVTSSGDDDADSMLSVSIGFSSNPTTRKSELAMNSRTMASKKPYRYPSACSAPKRSFDSAIRQMDQKRAPQNMFRPLLSSVPTTSFLTGKTNSMHRPMFSRNSSLTTSSNASSEHGTSVAPYTEDSDHEQNDLAGEWEKGREGSDIQEEIFVFDRVDELNEVTNHDHSSEKLKSGIEISEEDNSKRIDPQNLTKSTGDADQAVIESASQSPYAADGVSEVDCCGRMVTCIRCGLEFQIMEVDANANTNVCQECAERGGTLAADPGVILLVTRNETSQLEISTVQEHLCDAIQLKTKIPDLLIKDRSEGMLDNQELRSSNPTEMVMNKAEDLLEQNLVSHVENESLESHFDLETNSQSEVIANEPDGSDKLPEAGPNIHSNLKIDNPEATGISLLLQRSSSSKWPVVQGRAFASTNISCSEPSYARDNTTAMKRSIGRDSSSASSSVDLGSSRQTGACIQRNLSDRRVEIDKGMTDHLSYQATGSASELSINTSPAPPHPEHVSSEDFGCLVDNEENKVPKTTLPRNEEHDGTKFLSVEQAVDDDDTSVCANSCMDLGASQICRQPTADNLVTEDCNSCRTANKDLYQDGTMSNSYIELPSNIPESTLPEENHMINTEGKDEVADATTHCTSVVILEQHNDQISLEDQQIEHEALDVLSIVDALHGDHNSVTADQDVLAFAREAEIAELPHHANEEVSTIIEEPRREMQRSFTLEEATDIVLFCSSIVHDLAYKAADIAIEKELPLPEAPRPTVTIVGNSTSGIRDLRKASNKRATNTRKVKQKKSEADCKSPLKELAENLKSSTITAAAEVPKTVDSMKPPKLESKCNCTIM